MEVSQEKVSLKTAFCYGVGSLGNNLVYMLMNGYLMIYYTDSLGLKAAAVGTLFFITKIIDAVADTIIGIIIDNTHTRFGKFRPFLCIGAFAVAITTTLCFINVPLSDTGKLIYAYVTYILWSISFTIIDVPYWSMSATLTQDPKERTKIIAVPRTLGSVANFIVNLSTLALVAYFGNWIMVAIIFSLSELVLMLTTFFGVEEKHTKKREKRQNVREVIRLLKENRPLQLLLISFFLLETVNTIRNAFTIYFFKYNLDMPLAASLFLTVSSIATIVGSIFSPIIAAKIGKKNTAIYGKIVMGLFTMLIFFVSDNVVLVTIFNMILSIGMGVSNIAQASMLADCVEYGEWKTGNRAEGMVFSLNIFKAKVAGAFGSALGAYVLSGVGYVANAVQTPVALIGIKLSFTILPGILCLLALIPLFKYELTESRYLEILNDMRKNTFI